MVEFEYEMVIIYQQKAGDTIGFESGNIPESQEEGRKNKS